MSQYVDLEEFNELKNSYIETVELLANALKRITQLENALFVKNEDGDIIKNEDDKPIISSELAKAPEPAQKETEPVIPLKTTLEKKAVAFAEWLFKKTLFSYWCNSSG